MARVTLRIPDSLHEQLRQEAERQNVSLNTALVAAVAKWMEGLRGSAWLKEERDQVAIRAARQMLASHERAEPSVMSEEQIGQWAADFVREHRAR